ncbi:major facilitator superfamily domain-containing protein [Aspergillus bertholletiae]|uniref:Major facilitator superfamily domain-containing protein n=1 Tax=Aspergillus bertholletiae TaxID=1226010 RepID=A0A5N7BL48_9EURO|nr:major facilitator superfamily domain-containing protein [Aspergillus bertholletiae]
MSKLEPVEMENQGKIAVVAGQPTGEQIRYLHGWKLCLIILGLMISLYLVNLEVTVVSTSLISITSDLDGFNKTSWIVTGFLITYTGWMSLSLLLSLSSFTNLNPGFMSLWTKVSDIIGRKKTLLAAQATFLAFSLGCGLSPSVNTLIICRSFQGAGGAGVYPLTILCAYETVPRSKMPLLGSLLAMAIACASLTGPLIGGALAQKSAWRWAFYVNLPPGAVAVMMLLIAMPANHGSVPSKSIAHLKPSFALFRELDLVGAVLLLSGSLLPIAVLNETNLSFEWASGTAIGLLVAGAVSWMAFFAWEWLINGRPGYHPILPKRLIFNRAWIGMLITTFVSGCPWNVVIIYLAQRFQVLQKLSPLDAGIRLIPYSAVATVATCVASLACLRGRIPFVYLILFGSVLHTVGMALLSVLPQSDSFPSAGYGYEVIAGAGVGITIGICVLAVPYVVETRDLAAATGAINQCRFLGGAIGLAIAANIQYGNLKSKLAAVLSPGQLQQLLENSSMVEALPAQQQAAVGDVFARSYTRQYQAMIAFAAVQIPACLLMVQRGGQYVANEDKATDSDSGAETTV